MRHLFLSTLALGLAFALNAQQNLRVLFIGNSYIYTNNLPLLTANVALSMGDTLTYDSNTIGGYTLEQHSTNATTISKIAAQPWDYVILQEQSQLPSFPPGQVQADVLPYADSLVRMVRANDMCTKPMFYMTWGRKNGDASNCANYPPLCTYSGMQQRLHDSYLLMAQLNQAEVAPVGVVWRTVRDSFPSIELYNPDESHPSIKGGYLAACTFYASLFHKSPIGASYPSGVSSTEASDIQRMAHNIVFDSLPSWYIDTTTVLADFTVATNDSGLVSFANSSLNAAQYYWDFGDGNNSNDVSPVHQYADTGNYVVQLVATVDCKNADTLTQSVAVSFPVDTIIDTIGTAIAPLNDDLKLLIYPNPSTNFVTVNGLGTGTSIIEVYQCNGQRVFSQKVSGEARIDTQNWPVGVHLVKAISTNGVTRLGRLTILR